MDCSKLFRCSLLLTSFFITPSVSAEIYKWIDEKGKTHYSDVKQARNASNINIKEAGLPKPEEIKPLLPLYHRGPDPARWLFFYEPSFLAHESSPSYTATFYFGGDCVSPTEISWAELTERYSKSLPKTNRVMAKSKNSITKLGYRIQKGLKHKIKIQLEKNNGVLLEAEIKNMKLDACAPDLVKKHNPNINKYSQNLNNFHLSSFTQVQHWIRIKWVLHTSEAAKPIYQSYTEGISNNSFRQKGSVPNAIADSYNYALTQLFSDPSFTQLLNQNTSSKTNSKQKKTTQKILDKFTNMTGFSFFKKANLAEALSLAIPLKTAITQYYADQGRWPLDFSDIGYESHLFTKPNLIDSVNIIHDGIIDIDVSSSFGENSFIRLTPTDKNVRLDWRCTTNIETSAANRNCDKL